MAELKRRRLRRTRSSSRPGHVEQPQLDGLDDALAPAGRRWDKLTATLTAQRAALQAQLDVLGPPPDAGTAKEAPAVARQRRAERAGVARRATQTADRRGKHRQPEGSGPSCPRSVATSSRCALDSILNPRFRGAAGQAPAEGRSGWARCGTMWCRCWRWRGEPAAARGHGAGWCSRWRWPLGRRRLERGAAWFCSPQTARDPAAARALALATALDHGATTSARRRSSSLPSRAATNWTPEFQDGRSNWAS